MVSRFEKKKSIYFSSVYHWIKSVDMIDPALFPTNSSGFIP